ncbi:MAG: hypothetical protein R6X20_19060, partial [Phycisphaerae bacterium]
MPKQVQHVACLVASVLLAASAAAGAAGEYSWKKPHAKILPTGDLEWAPEPFVFEKGDAVRYIDYEAGDDSSPGTSKEEPWKHHPWDREATGKAAEAAGPITYVFKGGVAYRGQLNADESGEAGKLIRLTRDLAWGEEPPWLIGSVRLPAEWVRATEVKAPARLPEPEKVWALD